MGGGAVAGRTSRLCAVRAKERAGPPASPQDPPAWRTGVEGALPGAWILRGNQGFPRSALQG